MLVCSSVSSVLVCYPGQPLGALGKSHICTGKGFMNHCQNCSVQRSLVLLTSSLLRLYFSRFH